MNIIDIDPFHLGAGYLLLLLPLGLLLWLRVPILSQTLIAVLRMTVQLLFVGFYLQFIFELNNHWLTAAWVLIMMTVADFSIIRGCLLKVRRVVVPVFVALVLGTLIPLVYFVFLLLGGEKALHAQYLIPISGLILGNCLRADIIGLRTFYTNLKKYEKNFEFTLAQGASLYEALRPFMREACEAALAPTIATISTVGLVSLPGVMTGVILGGGDPMVAIKYQIAIMIAIFSGTAITVISALHFSVRHNFLAGGNLDPGIFAHKSARSEAKS
jgi:putative ABC transport system permease protein